MTTVLCGDSELSAPDSAAGEMRELGATSPQLHREAGKFAAETGKIDWVLGVEGDAAQIVEGAVAAGVPRSQTRVFTSSEEAAKFLADFVAPEIYCWSGIGGVKMERIVEACSLSTRRNSPAQRRRANRCFTTFSTTSCKNISAPSTYFRYHHGADGLRESHAMFLALGFRAVLISKLRELQLANIFARKAAESSEKGRYPDDGRVLIVLSTLVRQFVGRPD